MNDNSKSKSQGHISVTELTLENELLKRRNYELSAKFQQAKNLCADYAATNIKYIFYHNQFNRHPLYRLERWLRSFGNLFAGKRLKELSASDDGNNSIYMSWIEHFDRLTDKARKKIFDCAKQITKPSRFSVYLFASGKKNGIGRQIAQTIYSLDKQLYPFWDLVVIILGGGDFDLDKEIINRDRVRLINIAGAAILIEEFLSVISEDVNGYAIILEAGDQLSETALFEFASDLNLNSNNLIIYTDEDKINTKGERCNPFFKPDWNEELFLAQNYINRALLVEKKQITYALLTFPPQQIVEFEKLFFRIALSLKANNIAHIPSVLFHLNENSEALNWEDFSRSQDEVEFFFRKKNISAIIEPNKFNRNWMRVRRVVQKNARPLVSIIVPTRNNPDLLMACASGVLQNTEYKNIELIILDHINEDSRARAVISDLSKQGNVKTIFYDKPFNYSDMNNIAAAQAAGDILVLMNDDVEVIHSDWLDEIIGHFVDDKCGVVGAKLLYADRRIQHAGITCGYGGVAGHPLSGMDDREPGYFGRLVLPYELSAVTGACLAIRKDIYNQIGGMDSAKFRKKFNDVDLCLKVRELGYKVIWTPHVVLLHHESFSLGVDEDQAQFTTLMQETKDMLLDWAVILDDPFYNPNLSSFAPGYELAFPPRGIKPWDIKL